MSTEQKTNYPALYTLIGVFFFWGFIGASNGVFIPFCKAKFNLSQFQSQLIDSAFYFAYYIGAFILFLFSVIGKKDFLNSWGLKNGIVYGLILSVIGAFVMFPALSSNNFAFILGALFIIALGFSLQQTAAQPFAISLGDESTGAHRLNLAGGINSFGTTIGPIVFALALLGTTKLDESLIPGLSLSTVQWLYVIIGVAFLVAALLFKLSKKLPDGKNDASIENESKATILLSIITIVLVTVLSIIFIQYTKDDVDHDSSLSLYLIIIGIFALVLGLIFAMKSSESNPKGWGALKYPQLVLGMLGIFAYVGVEVAIQSNLGEYLKVLDAKTGNTNKYWENITPMLISLYWGSLMIGRWSGAISVFNLKSSSKQIAFIVVPYIAFLVILISNMIGDMGEKGINFSTIVPILPYAAVIIIQILGFKLGQEKPARTLLIFGLMGIVAMIVGIYSTGSFGVFALVSGGLFCSVMWPCIFSLATQGLGKYTSQGSAFLIMMILGGAFIPPLQGKLADMFTIEISYWVCVTCFVYLTFFAYIVTKILKNQGLNPNAEISGGH
jgi:FHS family L-fucose permease-like MFS transporter